jgi:hypothetical protein
MFSVEYDSRLGIVRTTTGGFLNVDDVRQHTEAAQDAVARSRREYGDVKALVIKLDAIVQPAEVMAASNEAKPRMDGPYDKMALVCSSALAKLQAGRNFRPGKEQIFETEAEAIAWLLADREGRSKAA